MAAAVELATGYVTLTVETSQVAKAIGRAFGDGEKFAAASGQKMGKAISQGLQKAQAPALDDLKAKLKDAEGAFEKASEKVKDNQAKLSAAMDRSAREQTNALSQVRIAEQKLIELREKGGNTAKIRIAEQNLAELRESGKASAAQLIEAEERVNKARETGKASASQIMAAEDKVARARQKHADVTHAGEAKVLAFRQALESSERSLKEAGNAAEQASADVKKLESSLEQGEDSVKRFGGAFSGLRQKISASFKGAFDGPKNDAREAGNYMEREFRNAGQKSGGGFKDSFKGAFAGLAAYVGVNEFVEGAKSAVMGAGNLEQSIGAVDSVFKENAGQIHNWAQTASTSLGISANSYNEFASLLGSKLKNAGTPMEELGGKTHTLIALGADLASMYGGTTADAVDSLTSAFNGQFDPIEKYGISINDAALTAKGLEMGITKTNGAFSEQEKQLIITALLFEQSADAQGNFAREADTFQGKLQRTTAQWEDLSAKLGELFLPALSGVIGFVSERALPAISGFTDGVRAFREAWVSADGDVTSSGFPGFMEQLAFSLRGGYETMQAWYPAWAPFAAAVGAATGAIVAYKAALTAISIAQGIQAGITTAYAIATGVAEGALWGLTAAQWAAIGPIALIVAGIAGLVVGVKMAYENIGWFRDAVDGAWAWIRSATQALVTWWTETAWPAIGNALAAAGEWFTGLHREHVAPAFGKIGEVISGFLNWWNSSFGPSISGALQAVGGLFTWLYESVIQPVWNGILIAITAAGAVILTIFDGITWVVSKTLGPIFTWLWENVIRPVFSLITDTIQGFSSWWNNTLVPAVAFGIRVLEIAWGLFQERVREVWDLVSQKISSTWNWIRDNILTPLGVFLDAVVGAAFRQLWNTVQQVWGWVSGKISSTWNWIRDTVLTPAVSYLDGTFGEAFRRLWREVSRVWEQISRTISDAWGWIKSTVLDPMGNYLRSQVVHMFELARDGIGRAWQGIKDLVREPVRFVVETVINGGLIKNYNKLNDFWGGEDLANLRMPNGFATGGWTGPGAKYDVAGVVHADEYVINKASRRRFEKENPGLLDHINRTGTLGGAAAGGHSHGPGTYCAHCAGQAAGHSTTASTAGAPPSGASGIWGAFQQQVARAGKLFVPKMNFMGVNTENVAKAWMGRSAVEIIAGNGSPGISFHSGGAGTWGFNSGSNIWMQPSVPGPYREGVLIHELGHALSLHHTMNNGSIMHPLVAGPKWPSALDYGALVRAWGAPGAGVKTYEGGGGAFSMLADKAKELITDKIKDLADGARRHFSPNKWVGMPIGFAEKSAVSIVEKAAEFFGGSSSGDSGGGGAERWRGTVKQALERAGLPGTDAYVNAWLKQIQTESGGNPRAIQQVRDVNSGGNEAAGLVQVIPSTFAAYRDKALPNDRFNPLASLTAGMNYAKARYGVHGQLNVIGKGHGYSEGGRVAPSAAFARSFNQLTPTLYDSGGLLKQGVQLIDHRRNTPDYVLTDRQWDAMYTLAEKSSSNAGVNIGAVYGADGDEVALSILKLQRQQEMLAL